MGLTALCAGLALGFTVTGALLQESVAYSYDVHGRLIEVVRVNASGPDSTSTYAYDPADNRTSRTITVTASRAAGDTPAVEPLPPLLDDTESGPVGSPTWTPQTLADPTDAAGEASNQGGPNE